MKKELEKMSWEELRRLEEALNAAKAKLEARLKETFKHGDFVRASYNGRNYEGIVKWRNSKTANMLLADNTMSPPIPWGALRLVKKAQAVKEQAEVKKPKRKPKKKPAEPKIENPSAEASAEVGATNN